VDVSTHTLPIDIISYYHDLLDYQGPVEEKLGVGVDQSICKKYNQIQVIISNYYMTVNLGVWTLGNGAI